MAKVVAKSKPKGKPAPVAQVPATTKQSTAAPANVRINPQLPAHLRDRMKADAGRGLSGKQEDNLVPMIYILQAQSPQVLKKNSAYIQGAEAGCILLRNAANPLVPVDEAIFFQPCAFDKDVVEWIPRDDGGGFVARHRFEGREDKIDHVAQRLKAKRIEDPKNPNKVRFVLPNGHELIETRYHIGYVGRELESRKLDEDVTIYSIAGQPMPFVIPLSSTGHTFSKAWMFYMNQIQGVNGIAPSYSRIYKLSTKFLQNTQGDWYGWDYEDIGWLDEVDFDRGRALNFAFEKGEKQIEEPLEQGGGGGADEAGSDRM